MRRYINYFKKLKDLSYFSYNLVEFVKLSLLSSPLFVMSISRQLSVLKNRELYSHEAEGKDSTALIKRITALSKNKKRQDKLIKASGVLVGQHPYQAPIYRNAKDAVVGLKNQGVLAFYKGNFWRIGFFAISQRVTISLSWALKDRFVFFERAPLFANFICFTAASMFAHPLFVLESRFILQNRLPEFKVYKNFWKFKTRSYSDFHIGALGHIPLNILFTTGFFLGSNLLPDAPNSVHFVCGQIMSYPVLTGIRRICCQNEILSGLLPVRYLNLLHCVALMRREEGIYRGWYAGFGFHIGACLIWYSLGSTLAAIRAEKKLIEEDSKLMDDKLFKEIQKRKLEQIIN